jgi:hypothetical protein
MIPRAFTNATAFSTARTILIRRIDEAIRPLQLDAPEKRLLHPAFEFAKDRISVPSASSRF